MACLDVSKSRPFRFFDLPPEIRTKILVLTISSPRTISLSSPSHFPHSLLLTSTQIYHEIRPLYFTQNKFSFTLAGLNHNYSWLDILAPSSRDNLMSIGSLRIVVKRWGKGKFWEGEVVKRLEEAVLIGRLRRIEIVVKEGWVEGWVEWQKEPWNSLRRLLRDPYLDKSRLLVGDSMALDAAEDEEEDGELLLVPGSEDGKALKKALKDVSHFLK